MQVDDRTFAMYEAAGLADAIALENGNRVMKRDPETDYCVKFSGGMCGIHLEKGAEMLGDACNFYPRVTRRLGEQVAMTATLSCPEIARLSLMENSGDFVQIDTARLPYNIANYEGDLKTHLAFLDACTAPDSPAKIMARIFVTANSLQYIDKNDWPNAAPVMLKMADARMPEPESYANDAKDMLLIFAAVFYATHKKMNPRLNEVLQQMETSLGAKINWQTLEIEIVNKDSLYKTLARKNIHDVILKKILAAQISFSTFPLAGLGNDIVQKARLLAFRFALSRLALISFENPDEQKIIQIIQSIARIMDHLGDATLTLNLMNQFGLDKEARIIGLIL